MHNKSPYKRDNSFPYDVLTYKNVDESTRKKLRQLIDTIWASLPFKHIQRPKQRAKYREMVKNFVLNLIKSMMTGKYIRISKNNNTWEYIHRYCHIHTTHTIILKTLNEMVKEGWMEEFIGYFDNSTEQGRQTRINPTPRFQKLASQNMAYVKYLYSKTTSADPKETIQLREKIKRGKNTSYKHIPYTDNKQTIDMRSKLARYNDHMSFYDITLTLPRETIQHMDRGHTEAFNSLLIGNIITLERQDQDITNTLLITPNTITKTLPSFSEENQSDISHFLNEQYHYSLDDILRYYPQNNEFMFRIPHRKMFRVFSNTGNRFDNHGRFYGDPSQNLNKHMRSKIKMNGKAVVECDYDSLHPTMLYVMERIEPPENVYLYCKNAHPQLRKECKLVLLISLNHNNPKTLWQVVSQQFRETLGYQKGNRRLKRKYIEDHLNNLSLHNNQISKYFNTGVAMKLMRKDSEIADRILTWFVDQHIPIRCIHDSFIVPEQHESLLKEVMVHFFKEVMETDYRIGVSKELGQSEKVVYGLGSESQTKGHLNSMCTSFHSTDSCNAHDMSLPF